MKLSKRTSRGKRVINASKQYIKEDVWSILKKMMFIPLAIKGVITFYPIASIPMKIVLVIIALGGSYMYLCEIVNHMKDILSHIKKINNVKIKMRDV